MKKISLFLFAFVLVLLPASVSAHALPVATTPGSSEVLDVGPSAVSMTFSEHIDPSASTIRVTDEKGALVSGKVSLDPSDTRTLHVPVRTSDGTYLVSWSVVSSDDGHFTRGAYPFAVGAGQIISSSSGSDVEIVQIATAPEAFSSAVELFGHGLLWAILLLFAFAIRPLIISGAFETEARFVRHAYGWFVAFGATLALLGGAAQIIVKSVQLAGLQSTDIHTAIITYLGTAAGSATLYRMIAVIAFVTVFFFARKVIVYAKKFTPYEILLVLILLVFAFMRAKISHATSNPFHPHFSILMNFFHVIEKDIWSGILAILVVFAFSKKMRRFLDALVPGAFRMLALDLAAVSVTAVYIVWLHLKSFGNIFTTQWGGAFLELLMMAVLLVGMRLYHVIVRVRYPKLFAGLLPATLAVEFAFAILVVYASSVVIITSPPLPHPPAKVFTAHDQGLTIALSQDQYEDTQLLLTDTGSSDAQIPVVTVQNTASGDEPAAVGLVPRFARGYVLPRALLVGDGPFAISVTIPQSGGYDAHANFILNKSDLAIPVGWESHRSFDTFTKIMLTVAFLALLFGIVLYRYSGLEARVVSPSHRFMPAFSAALAFVVAIFAATASLTAFHGSALQNPFAAECRADGNEWHIMLPTTAGVPTSQTPAEGCMWGMGQQMYMFPDKRAYDHYSNLGTAVVTLDTSPKTLTAGVPTALTVSLKNADGTPATLFMDMEKILHMIVISSDESEFAHIHADDIHPIPATDMTNSTFTFNYTFRKSGEYLIAVDYAHGTVLESKQFKIQVSGGLPQTENAKLYPTRGTFGGYDVSLDYPQPEVGAITTVKYTITKDGRPVTLVPYLAAAMHVAAVKNDFSWYLHVHGEYHLPGTPLPALTIKNGQVLHTMAMMVTPDTFPGPIEAHLIFPSAGVYTVWGQFKTQSGDVVVTSFTVRVE